MTQRKFMLAARIVSLLLVLPALLAAQDPWKPTEEKAARAAKEANFAEAEQLLATNLKYAETLSPKDPRRPRTLLDLAEVYRAEGKYPEAFPLYERALQIYTQLYGVESLEIGDTLNGEAELYKSLNDYAHAEPLLLRALSLRQKLLHAGDADIAQTENDLGELYTAMGAFDKARKKDTKIAVAICVGMVMAASVRTVIALVSPQPAVTQHTPGLPVLRAHPSAA